jgi:polysaccharide biosynthesis/export protein
MEKTKTDYTLYNVFLILLTAITISSCASQIPASGSGYLPNALTKPRIISVMTEETNDATMVSITADNNFSYNIYNHSEPSELVVDIPGAEFHNMPQEISVRKGVVNAIKFIKMPRPQDAARIEIELTCSTNYHVSKDENILLVTVGKQGTVSMNGETVFDGDAVSIDTLTGDEYSLFVKDHDYVIGGRDILDIKVYEEPDLSGGFRVSSEGYISFPLAGRVEVSGLTPSQLEERLEALLGDGYLAKPRVMVFLVGYHSKEVSILGAVREPGVYPIKSGKETLLEMVSRAEGINAREGMGLAGNDVFIFRPVARKDDSGNISEGVKCVRIDLQNLLRKGDMSLNLPIKGNDTIYVPLADSVFVFGEVKEPGAIKLLEKDITVLEAITMAGGPSRIAATNRTKIIRMEDGVEKTMVINIDKITKGDKSEDIILMPGDVVVVPETFF